MTDNTPRDEEMAAFKHLLSGVEDYNAELAEALEELIKGALRDARAEIEDWRGRLATQCGETLAARKLLDAARRQIEERDATIAERDRQIEKLTIKTPREQAMRETIDGQGLSMQAMRKEIEEQAKTIAEQAQRLEEAETEVKRLGALLDTHSEMMHPWYGPCDGFGPNGQCAECLKVLGREPFEPRPTTATSGGMPSAVIIQCPYHGEQWADPCPKCASTPPPTDLMEIAQQLYFSATHNYRLSGPMPRDKWIKDCVAALAAERAEATRRERERCISIVRYFVPDRYHEKVVRALSPNTTAQTEGGE